MDAQGISTFWLAILGSAAVGALVSAGITFIGQLLERRARRKELLLSKAIDLAFRCTDIGMKLAEKMGRPIEIQDDVMLAAVYFKELQYLIDKGDVTDEAKAIEERTRRQERERVAAERKAAEDKRREDDRKVDEWNNRLGR
ncbi:MAG: hypothetical protein WCC11_07180 [Gammaproteobacteria bacterium]